MFTFSKNNYLQKSFERLMLSENQELFQRILNKEKVEKKQIDLPVKSKKKEKRKRKIFRE